MGCDFDAGRVSLQTSAVRIPGSGVRALLQRIADDGTAASGTVQAFVAGWVVDPRTEAAAFRRGLLQCDAPDIWTLTERGAAVLTRIRTINRGRHV